MTVIACQRKMNRSITTPDRSSSHNDILQPITIRDHDDNEEWSDSAAARWRWSPTAISSTSQRKKKKEKKNPPPHEECATEPSHCPREKSALECTGPNNMHTLPACLFTSNVHEFQGTDLRRKTEGRGCLIVRRANKNSDVNKMEMALFWLLIDILGILPRATLPPSKQTKSNRMCSPTSHSKSL